MSPGMPRKGAREAFTLIEVLVVVAIIALLVAILLPSLNSARKNTRRTICLSNLHQISVALMSYAADHKSSPPRWMPYRGEQVTDGVALWVYNADTRTGHATRLGMLYPRYVGKNENLFYCPDARYNRLLSKGDGVPAYYPWTNYGRTNVNGWAYGSYEYRPRYAFSGTRLEWVGANYDKFRTARLAIVADGFAGSWDTFGPFPVHTPVNEMPQMLFYNVAYMDGSASRVRDFRRTSPSGSTREFGTRSGPLKQQQPLYRNSDPRGPSVTLPSEYTPLEPGPLNPPLPTDVSKREQALQGNHIERGWTFFDKSR